VCVVSCTVWVFNRAGVGGDHAGSDQLLDVGMCV